MRNYGPDALLSPDQTLINNSVLDYGVLRCGPQAEGFAQTKGHLLPIQKIFLIRG